VGTPTTRRTIGLGRLIGVAAVVGAVLGVWFVLIEAAVKEGTDLLWNDLLDTDDVRWLVVPTAVVLGVGFAALLRALGQERLIPMAAGMEIPDDDDASDDVARITAVGFGSLLAGASLGPEKMLVESSAAIATWTSRRLRIEKAAARTLTLAAIGALMVAFLGSLVMVALPLLIVVRTTKRLAPQVVAPIVVAAVAAWVTLWLIEGSDMGFGSIPAPSDVALHDYTAAALTGLLVGLLALALAGLLLLLRSAAEHVDRTLPWWLAAASFGLGLGVLYLVGGPTVEFTGSAGTGELLEEHAGDSAWVLAGLALVKVLATAWSLATGYRGGLYFPSIYAGVATGLAVGAAWPSLAGPGAMVGAVAGIFVGLTLPKDVAAGDDATDGDGPDPDGDGGADAAGGRLQPYVGAVVTSLLFIIALVPLEVVPLAVVGIATAVVANVVVLGALARLRR
jgi:H+/Cl- antiporter ClcA